MTQYRKEAVANQIFENESLRVRNQEFIDTRVRNALHEAGQKSVERETTCTGTTIWYCGQHTVICYAGHEMLERMSDEALADWISSTMKYRIEKRIK